MEQCTYVNQSPSILRAPQLARAKRGVPQRRLPAWCWCARIPFRFRPCLSPLSVYFTRVHGHSLTPVPAHACWILRWEALHIVLLQIVLQASSGTKAWHSTMCREKAALTKNGENSSRTDVLPDLWVVHFIVLCGKSWTRPLLSLKKQLPCLFKSGQCSKSHIDSCYVTAMYGKDPVASGQILPQWTDIPTAISSTID